MDTCLSVFGVVALCIILISQAAFLSLEEGENNIISQIKEAGPAVVATPRRAWLGARGLC